MNYAAGTNVALPVGSLFRIVTIDTLATLVDDREFRQHIVARLSEMLFDDVESDPIPQKPGKMALMLVWGPLVK